MTRRTRIKILLLAAILAGLSILFYMVKIEPFWLKVERQNIVLPHWHGKQPLTILQLSDFHVNIMPETMDRAARAVELGLKEHPDLIFLTGDFVTGQGQDGKTYTKILKRLGDAAPTFAVFGNHDGGSWTARFNGYENHRLLEKWLTAAGITPLVNTANEVTVRGERVRIVGLGDLWNGELRSHGLLPPEPPELTLLLVHNPDVKEVISPVGWDLMFCGHTHGGQFYLPGIGYPFAPVRDKNFVVGLHPWQGRYIHISAGVGNLHGIRLNSRPQVSVIRILKSPTDNDKSEIHR